MSNAPFCVVLCPVVLVVTVMPKGGRAVVVKVTGRGERSGRLVDRTQKRKTNKKT